MQEPFHLKSFEDEANHILEVARGKGKEILVRTLKECRRLRETAQREGRAAGREEGAKQAAEVERKRIASEVAPLSGVLKEMTRAIEGRRKDLLEAAERDVVQLAVAIAEKIVKGEVASGRKVAAANVRRAVEIAVNRGTLEIRLNPRDHSLVEKYLPELTSEFSDIDSVELRDDPSVERGGCVVHTRKGKIDADLGTQLGEIERALLGGDDSK
jgi:flagellar assembly protein FliH